MTSVDPFEISYIQKTMVYTYSTPILEVSRTSSKSRFNKLLVKLQTTKRGRSLGARKRPNVSLCWMGSQATARRLSYVIECTPKNPSAQEDYIPDPKSLCMTLLLCLDEGGSGNGNGSKEMNG